MSGTASSVVTYVQSITQQSKIRYQQIFHYLHKLQCILFIICNFCYKNTIKQLAFDKYRNKKCEHIITCHKSQKTNEISVRS